MRLVFICGAGIVAGKERQTLSLMSALKERGHDIFCVMASWGSASFEELLIVAKIPYTRMRIGFISKTLNWPAIRMTLHQLIYLPSLWRDYRRLMRTFKPQAVIHSNFHHLFLLLPVLGKNRQIFHVHDFFSPGRFMKALFSRFDKKIDLFIGVSRFICDSLLPLGVTPSRIRLVYNGVVMDEKAEFVKSGPDVLVAIVGQVGPWKGHAVLLDALARVESRGWKLHVIGEGPAPYIASLRDKAERLGIFPHVEFKGNIRGLGNIYRGLDIVCVPSVMPESFGLAAAEPGFFGIPVICSSVGALPEIVRHEVTGLVVAPGDAAALSGALGLLIGDAAERKRLGDNALQFVTSNFSMNAAVGNFEAAVDMNLDTEKSIEHER
jgi:glycosyltransferase involved in cell wall biosynthesis